MQVAEEQSCVHRGVESAMDGPLACLPRLHASKHRVGPEGWQCAGGSRVREASGFIWLSLI